MNDPTDGPWTLQETHTGDGRGRRLAIHSANGPLRFAQVIAGWRDEPGFRDFYTRAFAALPHAAYFWEHPPLTRARLETDYECVAIDSPALARVEADPGPFAGHFREGCNGADAVSFANLGGDARLVVPCPNGERAAHLAAFLRLAEVRRSAALWVHLATALEESLGTQPLWLSTSGLGVYWPHLRLDSRPKYYTYAPYRRPPET